MAATERNESWKLTSKSAIGAQSKMKKAAVARLLNDAFGRWLMSARQRIEYIVVERTSDTGSPASSAKAQRPAMARRWLAVRVVRREHLSSTSSLATPNRMLRWRPERESTWLAPVWE